MRSRVYSKPKMCMFLFATRHFSSQNSIGSDQQHTPACRHCGNWHVFHTGSMSHANFVTHLHPCWHKKNRLEILKCVKPAWRCHRSGRLLWWLSRLCKTVLLMASVVRKLAEEYKHIRQLCCLFIDAAAGINYIYTDILELLFLCFCK